MITAAIITGTLTVLIGAPILLLRSLTSDRGQRFIRWCFHEHDDA